MHAVCHTLGAQEAARRLAGGGALLHMQSRTCLGRRSLEVISLRFLWGWLRRGLVRVAQGWRCVVCRELGTHVAKGAVACREVPPVRWCTWLVLDEVAGAGRGVPKRLGDDVPSADCDLRRLTAIGGADGGTEQGYLATFWLSAGSCSPAGACIDNQVCKVQVSPGTSVSRHSNETCVLLSGLGVSWHLVARYIAPLMTMVVIPEQQQHNFIELLPFTTQHVFDLVWCVPYTTVRHRACTVPVWLLTNQQPLGGRDIRRYCTPNCWHHGARTSTARLAVMYAGEEASKGKAAGGGSGCNQAKITGMGRAGAHPAGPACEWSCSGDSTHTVFLE